MLLNLPELTNGVNADPVLEFSALKTDVKPGILPGLPKIDPSIGFFHEALGKYAADEVLHGRTPWWNALEGAGLPLAGEMNSSPFFPLMPLLELPHGQVIIQVLIEVIAGVATFALLRELEFAAFAATFGALLFEVNGTIAWLGGGWSYPIPFLPLLLYGIEKLRSSDTRQCFQGGCWVSVSVAASISAGFIEIAYLDGLLGVAWAAVRYFSIPRNAKLRFLGLLVGSGVTGLLLAAPIIIAFLDYLNVAILGIHSGSAGKAHLGVEGVAQLFLPYSFGPIFYFAGYSDVASRALTAQWGRVGGFAGFGMCVLAVSALFGTKQRTIRWLLAAWVTLTVSATFGLWPIEDFVVRWPGVKYTAYYRYFDTSWEFALAILAAFTIHDSLTLDARSLRARVSMSLASVTIGTAIGLGASWSTVRSLWVNAEFTWWFASSLLCASGVAALLMAANLHTVSTRRALILSIIVVTEAAVLFLIPNLAYPTSGTLATGGVDFLKRNLGNQRMYSLGPVAPNYGSYYGIASINHDDLPVAKLWGDYVSERLDAYTNPLLFTGTYPAAGDGYPSREQELWRNLAGFAATGVKYVLTFPGDHLITTQYEPKTSSDGLQALPLRAGSTVQLRLPSIPAGRLSGIEILQATYSGTADGELAAKLCVGNICLAGQRPLIQSPNNKYFYIPFRKALHVPSLTATISLQHIGGFHDEAIYVLRSAPHTSTRLLFGSQSLPGMTLRFRLSYELGKFETPVHLSNNVAYSLVAGKRAQITLLDAIPKGFIDSVSLFQATSGGTADGILKLRACSESNCVASERSLRGSQDNAFLAFTFRKALEVSRGKVAITVFHLGGKHPNALWLFPQLPGAQQTVVIDNVHAVGMAARLQFNYSRVQSAPTLVYGDEGMEIYRLRDSAPYFQARGCTVKIYSRTELQTFCRAPTTLRRLELFMAGWFAIINGRQETVRLKDGAFQTVDLPQGKAVVSFTFVPPFMLYGYIAFSIGCAAIIFQIILTFRTNLRFSSHDDSQTGI